MILVSIIVPVYKVEAYLDKCVNSILNQTYKNLEIILVDDGSPDLCPTMCDRYSSYDSRIKVIHKKNGGLSDARNAGVDIARGEYICFVDSDDWVSLDMIERLLESCLKNSVEIAACSYYEVDKQKFKLNSICSDDHIINVNEAICELIEGKTFKDFACNKMYKRYLFDDIRYPKGRNVEDIATTYKLFLKVSKIVVIETALYYYRVNRLGSITTNISLKTVGDAFDIHVERYKNLKSRFPQEAERLQSYIFIAALTFYIRYKEIENTKELEKFNEIKKYIDNNYHKDNRYIRKIDILKYKIAKINIYLYKAISNFVKMLKSTKIRLFYLNFRRIYLRKKYELKKHDFYDSGSKKIVLFGLPEHNNLGDHAIRIAERNFIHKSFPDYQLIEVSEELTDLSFRCYKNFLNDTDIVALTGGGDIGNQYLYIEHRRQRVIKAFSKQKIVIFPQTIFFTNDEEGRKELKRSKKVYSSHRNLTIYLREKISYSFAKKEYSNNVVKLCPDIVLSLNMTKPYMKRNGALLCLRSDLEGKNTIDNLERLREAALKKFTIVDTTDTAINRNLKFGEQETEVKKKLNSFKQHSLVITDRLHGVIFCAITSTPCIALSSYNHKVKGICEWLSEYKFIKYADCIESAIEIIENFSFGGGQEYDTTPLEKYYDNLKNEFKSW